MPSSKTMEIIFKFDDNVNVKELGTLAVQVTNVNGRTLARVQIQDRQSACGHDSYFRKLIQHPDPERLIKRLHALIDGQHGAAVGSVLLRCVQQGYLRKCPTQVEFCSEFELIGTWSSIHNYMNENSVKALVRANAIVIF